MIICKEYEKFENQEHNFKNINQNYKGHREFFGFEFWYYENKEWMKNIIKKILFCFKFKN